MSSSICFLAAASGDVLAVARLAAGSLHVLDHLLRSRPR